MCPWCQRSAQWVSASAWTGSGSFVSNVCAMQFWWFVEYVFRYLFSRPCTSKNKEEGCASVPQLPPPGVVADKPVMAQPASDEPASPEGGADDGAFCVGSGLSESRHTCPRDRSSTHDLPACAHHSPPLCMRDTRPQCTTRCALLVSLGSVGVACVLTAGALLLAACWCARRRDAASRFASCPEPAAAAQYVASVLPHGSATHPSAPRRPASPGSPTGFTPVRT